MKKTPHALSFAATALVVLALLPAAPSSAAGNRAPRSPQIVTDTSAAPDLKEWAAKADVQVRAWYPKLAYLLANEESRQRRQIKIVYDPNYNGVAATGGDTITCSPEWFRKHPDDVGALIHEMAHVQQSYPRYDPVWLVEGIADYARWFVYEPKEKRPRPNPDRSTARDSYRTTGAFLDYLTRTYDKNIVRKLSRALKEQRYTEDYFQELTGKTLDELDKEWRASLFAERLRQ
jgi:hypothetical protein